MSAAVSAASPPADIALLRTEQGARVTLSACDYAAHGGPAAKLEHISADSIPDESGESFFLTRVRTERSFLGTEAAPLKIIPGMNALVDILTGEKPALD